ncbi:MAG: histidine kinase [Rhizobiales bacterium]|nr:histidine kinase [Hyphomicrobiales bacterium]MBA67518.1 histidine kinase [Hyphomicrobiales bacterium]
MSEAFTGFVRRLHPFDALDSGTIAELAKVVTRREVEEGATLLSAGDMVTEFSLIVEGTIDLVSREGTLISQLREGDYFGGLALLNDGRAVHSIEAASDAVLYDIPGPVFQALVRDHSVVDAYFNRAGKRRAAGSGVASPVAEGWLARPLSDLMSKPAFTCPAGTQIREAARLMSEQGYSCILAVDDGGNLAGILTARDMTRIVAEGRAGDTLVSEVMTADPFAASADQTGFDAVVAMSERGFGHLPVVAEGKPVGILTQTDLVRRHSVSAVFLIRDIASRNDYEGLAAITANIPTLLAHLVGAGVPAHQIGRMITSISDAATRRLIAMAIDKLGPPPVPWLWLACGSQGRREQTGVSDQDNCLFLSDEYDETEHGDYFAAFAKFVSDGLNAAGYVYCPGDMMATNPRWRQPASVWRGYFEKWIRVPEPMAQMLASVMFDLRAIDGDSTLYEGVQAHTLEMARQDSIFQSHMIGNSLKHQPPLGLFRGFALIRGGEHKNTIDMKHSGVVPIVDLGRVYALKGAIPAVNTRERLVEAIRRDVLSDSGGADLLDAFDLVSMVRLQHQARQVREGEKPDNFLVPSRLSALERNHLRDAFAVVKSLQSSLGYGRL